ncbi:MAG TPA: flagellar hook assembly protein FlgD [Spirochaetota bacterium]|nr:flagellar hook assembly protein FlgD [Spirochaetota bacterium]
MEGIGNEQSMLNFSQSAVDKFKTKMEVDTVNKAIKKDGKEVVQTMGKDQFLKLLITELQHQDPTNPMQDREFIAQMAQFSALEQMVNFNTGMNKLINTMNFQQSFSLLGKNVQITTTDSVDDQGNAQTVNGVVSSIKRNGEDTLVTVNGNVYSANLITSVE